ncbi:MAG: rhodanese-related sulfurtransferase [Chloroflexi bacterium]|nr:rhodanese-related sulfurtransferase [Chloroflexota bacterium]
MPEKISAEALDALLKGKSRFALIDVREPGEYNSSHIPGASLIPRRQLEFQMRDSVPGMSIPIVVCDDDGRRADLAAGTIEGMGYERVSVLDGGINRWVTLNYPTEWGVNVPSKDFGERVEVENHVPEIDAVELNDRIARGDELVILDTRTPEEYQRFCIPGGRSVPGGELALRITDITRDLGDGATVIINCAGRTRSIIGTRVLQRMGLANVYGLKNGTAGWVLAGLELETGADRTELPQPSTEGLNAAESYADRLAAEDGVRFLQPEDVQSLMSKRDEEPVYFIDVRTQEEYEGGHIPGFRWFPGGQSVQRADEVAVVKNCPIVFCCDGRARATITASWYRQLGFDEVYVLMGGTTAWLASGRPLAQEGTHSGPVGLAEALSKVKSLRPDEVVAGRFSTIIFVDTSQDFSMAHLTDSRWVPRGWLELQITDIAPNKAAPLLVTCVDGRNAALAGGTVADMGYSDVSVLAGGTAAWLKAGLDVQRGLTGVMTAPTDVLLSGIDRNSADMMNYLRWEEALGTKFSAG